MTTAVKTPTYLEALRHARDLEFRVAELTGRLAGRDRPAVGYADNETLVRAIRYVARARGHGEKERALRYLADCADAYADRVACSPRDATVIELGASRVLQRVAA